MKHIGYFEIFSILLVITLIWSCNTTDNKSTYKGTESALLLENISLKTTVR